MNLTFSKKLLIGQLFTFGLFLIFAVTVIFQINNFKDEHLIVTGTQYEHTVNMERIKLDVIQIQQWLTDISATKGEDGLDDGLKKAEEYYQDLIATLNLEIEAYKKENRPEKIEIIEKIKKSTEVYYQTGKKMADLYMHQGTKSGNAFMAEFDKASEELQNSLNPLVKETSEMFSRELANSDRKLSFLIKFSIGAIIFIFIIFILFTFIFNKNLTQQLSKVVKGLVSNSGDLESASLSLFEESAQIASSSTEQSMAVESSASALHELSTTISSNAEYANQAKRATETGVSTTQKGIETLNEVLVSIDQISQNNIEVINEMQAMNKEVTEIVKVIEEIENKTKIINDIVFQTKLLSFNASVEAARAGEAGKGFAVVAEEVGNLSNMSGQAAKDISTLLQNGVSKIKRIVDDSNSKVEYLSQDGTKKVSSIMNVVNQSKGVLDEIVYNVENIQKMVNKIALASTEQSNGLNNISSSFSQIEVATKENAMIAENSNTQSF
jgi:methyl-accepting chemotaxis protein